MSAAVQPITPESLLRQLPSVRIISIAPIAFSQRLQATNGFKTYELPAAPRDGWTYCDVEPEMPRIPDFDDDMPKGTKPVYEDPAARAAKLVSLWSYRRFGSKRRGSFGVAALPPGEKTPTPQLLAQLRVEQEALANSLVTEANDLAESGNQASISNELHRPMALWVLGNNAERLPWYGMKNFASLKNCPACSEQIPALASKCRHCSTDLIEWHMKYDPEAAGDPAIAARVAALRPPAPEPAPAEVAVKPVGIPPPSAIRPPVQQPVK